MNPNRIQQSLQMSNLGITFFFFSEIILLLFILFDEISGFKGFIIKLMAIIFPVILVWLITDRNKFIQKANEKKYFVNQMRQSFRDNQNPNNVSLFVYL